MTQPFPVISVGSTIAFQHRDREIVGVVMAQDPEDGSLTCFCFHFEGQFQATVPVTRRQGKDVVPNVRVLYDPAVRIVPEETIETQYTRLLSRLREDLFAEMLRELPSLRKEFVDFQDQVLSLVTADAKQSATPAAPPTGGSAPAGVESTSKSKRP